MSLTPHTPTNTNTSEVTIALGVCGGAIKSFEVLIIIATILNVIQPKKKKMTIKKGKKK